MRGFFNTSVILLVLSAAATFSSRVDAQDSGWRPSRQHSTIDRSQLQPIPEAEQLQPVAEDPTALDQPTIGAPAFEAIQVVYQDDETALGGGIQQAAQSSEVAPIESPLTFQPFDEELQPYVESDWTPGADLNPDCPGCSSQPSPWITRKSTKLSATWLPAGDNDIGWTDLDVRTKLGFGALENLTVQPAFQLHFIDGPTRTDLPENLYGTQLELRWKQQISRPFWIEAALTPGFYSDFEGAGSDAFRLKAQGLAFFAFSVETQVVAGLYYLDRFDINYLPIFGLIHSPREDIKLNLVFPAPKVSMRVRQGMMNDEWWAYLSGEFGGGSWAVERVPGVLPGGRRNDQIAYRDWRLILGLERKTSDAMTMFFEAGYVFQRQLEYDSGRGDFDPDDTAMLRIGVSY
ncbi:MAG: hypothetical protein HON53_02090 [Planctomycetaceae bacterium]|nr:hypothetical protein [Planctomycetaceae bacterium]MBT6154632.1 hypothetical protein [Planctomycetaceae bacterium]MBT6485375.1 hypothetical protein [Planctomycetaceae bacterium]MBT6495130.1 hypothetical protein [Planctomycetaceae bacterium]